MERLAVRFSMRLGQDAPADGDEDKPDTARIQAAIDHCPAGQAVVLQRAAYRTDAFLSGPLQLRKGVVLVVGLVPNFETNG